MKTRNCCSCAIVCHFLETAGLEEVRGMAVVVPVVVVPFVPAMAIAYIFRIVDSDRSRSQLLVSNSKIDIPMPKHKQVGGGDRQGAGRDGGVKLLAGAIRINSVLLG